jgi:hypothetical protein
MLGFRSGRFRRWRDRPREEGPEGLRDRRIGKPSSRRAAAEEIIRMVGLYEERYAGFTVKHFHEQLQKRHTAVQFRRSRSLMVLRVCRGNPP